MGVMGTARSSGREAHLASEAAADVLEPSAVLMAAATTPVR